MCEGISCTSPLQIVQVLSALLTPTIALVVAYVAYQQWRTNQATLREKLFERRFEIFRETQRFLTMLSGKDDNLDIEIWSFNDIWQRSHFLFSKDTSTYLKSIRDKAFDTQFQKSVMNNPSQYEDHMAQIHNYSENRKWYNAQLSVIFNEFAPYLSFDKH